MTTEQHPALLTDEQLHELGIEDGFNIFEDFDQYDLSKIYDLLGATTVFGALIEVKDVTLLSDAIAGGTVLTVAFTTKNGWRLCTAPFQPKDLIDFNLTGFEQARDIVTRAHDLIAAAVNPSAQPAPEPKELPGDDEEVTLTWRTVETLRHEHTFTWGELRELLGAEPGEDVSDRLYELANPLAEYDNETPESEMFERDEIEIKEGT